MDTIIKIKTWGCACGYKQDFEPTQELMDLHFNQDRLFSVSDVKEGECPSCRLKHFNAKTTPKETAKLSRVTDPNNTHVVTIRDEADFDHPDLIEHNGNFVFRQHADADDAATLQDYLFKVNRSKVTDAMAKGEKPVLLTEKDNHGWKAPKRRELTKKEREQLKAKVRADILKFKALEHK